MERLFKYLRKNKIYFRNVGGHTIEVEGKTYKYVEPKNGKHFNEEFHFLADDTNRDRYIYRFGGRYYWLDADEKEDPTLNLFKYIGQAKEDVPTDTFLGVHGGFEILNGSGRYDDWAKKAKFLGVKHLGIADKNTLAGVVKFQQACEAQDIQPIIGATYTISRPSENYFYDATFFAKDEQGWINLLNLNKACNVDYDLTEDKMVSFLEGLVMVLDPKEMRYEKLFPLDLSMNEFFFKMDTVEYRNDADDIEYLKNLKKFFRDDRMNPLPFGDAYYLDKEHQPIKFKLNVIGKKHDFICLNQHFKSKEEYFLELIKLFKNEDEAMDAFQDMLDNESIVAEMCSFRLTFGQRHLPRYKMKPEEKERFKTPINLFWHLIEKGMIDRKIPDNKIDEYLARLEKEVHVLEMGDVIDYFLITWDIIDAARKEGKLVGFGRGSSGGCLVSYLLGIVQIDALEFDLLFERFLTEERMKKSLPDIDSDFSGRDRDWVKKYMEQRFGETQVCSVGTYTKLQLKSAMSDLYRQQDNDYDYIKTITKKIGGDDDESDGRTITDLFKLAVKDNDLKGFVKNYPDIINDMSTILQQPKAKSVHACAMMIFPKERSMYNWTPVRYDQKKKMVVSELEGEELDTMGLLKFDALGIKQLDKWQDILDLIKKNHDEDLDIYTLPLDDKEVYKYFKKGWNSDVFQFGSKGLSEFSKQLKPRTIHDLIAGVALYRPGAMENHFHTAYCKRKDGKEPVEYMWGTEQIAVSTYGLMIYQEQIMQMCVDIGGFTGDESNSTLKALGKKKVEKLKPWKEKFVTSAISKGCPLDEAEGLWDMMLEFAKYSFNLSHSTAYAITGYICQWFKVHYPTEFWTVAFRYADPKKDIPRYLSEINKIGGIKVLPPDVNVSTESMGTDFENSSIHFGLVDIKFTGEGAANQIVEERSRNGEFVSLEDFVDRHIYKGSKVTKRNVEGLILSGAFDTLESVNLPSERHALLVKYYAIADVKVDEKNKYREKKKDWWWTLVQKEFSGIAFFDYPSLARNNLSRVKFGADLITGEKLHKEVNCVIGGFVTDVDFRKGKRGEYAKVYLEMNYEFIAVTIWTDSLKANRDEVANSKGGLMLISGTAKFDSYQKRNMLHSNDGTKIKVLK